MTTSGKQLATLIVLLLHHYRRYYYFSLAAKKLNMSLLARLDTPFASRPSNRWEDSQSADGSYFIERRSPSLRSHLTAWSATGLSMV